MDEAVVIALGGIAAIVLLVSWAVLPFVVMQAAKNAERAAIATDRVAAEIERANAILGEIYKLEKWRSDKAYAEHVARQKGVRQCDS